MKVLLILVVTIITVTAVELNRDLLSSWRTYKMKFNKIYANATEDKLRYLVWLMNRAIIDSHNAKTDTTFTMDDNELTDLTEAEIQVRLGTVVPSDVTPLLFSVENPHQVSAPLPTEVDWRTSPCMPPIKDQGSCGSCWAFAATNLLEFATCKKASLKQAAVLSESQLLNCSWALGNHGCNGGWFTRGWDYIKDAPGQASASSLPYYPADSKRCLYNSNMKAATLSSYVQLQAGNTAQIMESVATQGPLAAAMAVLNSFYNYKSGVYADPNCLNPRLGMDHAVAIVGYGSSNSTDYWIVRNSWGTSWGTQGYFLIKRGVNMCRIETLVYYVIV